MRARTSVAVGSSRLRTGHLGAAASLNRGARAALALTPAELRAKRRPLPAEQRDEVQEVRSRSASVFSRQRRRSAAAHAARAQRPNAAGAGSRRACRARKPSWCCRPALAHASRLRYCSQSAGAAGSCASWTARRDMSRAACERPLACAAQHPEAAADNAQGAGAPQLAGRVPLLPRRSQRRAPTCLRKIRRGATTSQIRS
jgi:hypothetical protein